MKKGILVLILFIYGYSNLFASDLQLYEAGKKAFSVGLYSIAIENLTQYLETSDGSDREDDSIYMLGTASFYLKKYNKSLSYFKGLHADYIDSPFIEKSRYWMGINYYNLKDYSNAAVWFKLDGGSNSEHKDLSNLYHALSEIKLGNLDSGKNILSKIAATPGVELKYAEEALYRLSTLYLEELNPNKAITYLNKLVFDYSDSKYYTESLALLGEAYFQLKEWDNARRAYLLLIEDSKIERETSYKRLASIYFKLGDLNNSKIYLEKYISEYGEDLSVLTMLGDILIKLNNNSGAISVLTRLNEMNISDADKKDNSYKLGTLYFKSKNYTKAYNEFKKVDTKESLYFLALSGMYADIDLLEEVIKFNNLYQGDKYALDINNRYINLLEKRGDKGKLEELLKVIVHKYPDNISYALTYGEFLLENRRYEESLKYLSRGYNKDSEHYSNISYKIGWIYYNKGEFSRSIDYFDSLKPGDDDYLKALYSKSIAHYQIGNLKKGREGFIALLGTESDYKAEVSFYLGMIEKDNYKYSEAIKYFSDSMKKASLYKDSKDNIAWCYYHLKKYDKALTLYLSLSKENNSQLYTFNAANCYFYLQEYGKALNLYSEVSKTGGKLRESAYYKVVEILFFMGEDTKGYTVVKEFYNNFPTSNLPFEVIFNIGDNRLYNDDPDGAMEIYNEIMSIFKPGKNWEKARFRMGEVYRAKAEYVKGSDIYLKSIVSNDSFFTDSVKELVNLLSYVSDPGLTSSVIEKLNRSVKDKSTVIPLYIENIRQNIFKESILNYIDEMTSISKSRKEIDTLIYLKGLHYYTISNFKTSTDTIKPLLARAEVHWETKIEALLLQASIFEKDDKNRDAIDLYLKIYLTYSKRRERASYAIYKGLMLTKVMQDEDLYNKLYKILKNEYKDTIWGKRGLNE